MSVSSLKSLQNAQLTPSGHIHAGLLAQVVDVDLVTDESIVNADGQVTLLSTIFTKKDSDSALKMSFCASASNDTNATQMRFRLRIDGVVQRACGCRGQNNFAQAAALQHIHFNLPAGAHTIDVQWSTTGGTASIRPVTHSDDESATLIIEEILQP